MLKKILELSETNKFVSIYVNERDTSKFVFGRILCANDDYVVIYMIAPNGRYDGVLVKDINNVIRIEFDDKYADRMNQLINEDELYKFDIVLECHDILMSILKIAKKEHKILSLELLNSEINDVVGFVENIDENLCTIKQVDLYGNEDGISYIKLNDITQISFDSDDEQIILNLWKKINDY